VLERHKRERIYSSIKLFLDACVLWSKTFENEALLAQVKEMEDVVYNLDMHGCPDDTIYKIESATLILIDNMDQVLKSFGSRGITYQGAKH
jgi:hypothetical protein